jgi:asparagine synthase (glutamine-hydrolysing)
MFQKDKLLATVLAPNILRDISSGFFDRKYFEGRDCSDFESLFMRTDRQSWLVDESLTKTDKTSMAAGLEARVPFLDIDLVSFAESLPRSHKVTLFETKRLSKYAYQSRLPAFLYGQPKRGWFTPAAKWLRHPHIYEYASEVLSARYNHATKELFNWHEIENMLADHRAGKRYNLTLIWSLLAFQAWVKRFNVQVLT